MENGGRALRLGPGELAGAVADLGVFVPLVAALVLVVGLDPAPVLLIAGLFAVFAGLRFNVPFPVQPLKALTAVAVAQQASAEVVHAAGLMIGLVLLLLTVGRVADALARVFTKPVVRALQHGVGILLMVTAVRLVMAPPDVFTAVPPVTWSLALAGIVLVAVIWSVASGRHLVAVLLFVGGAVVSAVVAPPALGGPEPALPALVVPDLVVFPAALVLLVIPQIPLTFGNAVVAVTDLSHRYFGANAVRVTPSSVCRSAAAGNIAAALLGGMPMCHGSSGLTAHYRLGARNPAMNVVLGGTLAGLGLFFGPQVLALFGVLPVWVLGAFLVYAGARHALLVTDLRGVSLVLAIVAGLAGAVLGNLAVTTGLALVVDHGRRLIRSRRPPEHLPAG